MAKVNAHIFRNEKREGVFIMMISNTKIRKRGVNRFF